MTLTEVEAWARIYELGLHELSPSELGFRRNAELTLQCVLRHARPGQRWLDLGAGPGWLTGQLARGGMHALGIEIDRDMLRLARARSSGAHSGSASFVLADAAHLPVAAQSVDGVVAVSLLGALKSPKPVLREAARVLRPGGLFVATASNHESRLAVLHAWMQRLGLAPVLAAGFRQGGYRGYAGAPLTAAAKAAGLTVTELTYHQPALALGAWSVPPRRTLSAVERVMNETPLARHLGRAFLLVARRGT